MDNDDGQWSDWEHDPARPEPSTEISQPLSLSPPTTVEESVLPKPVNSTNKSLKLNNISKAKWNPNAPLGSEYEIPPVVLKKQKSGSVEISNNQEIDDFFKDMAPKVETVELMQQLETMFSADADPSKATRTAKTKVPAPASTFSNKFGMVSPERDDIQELDSGNNHWDE